MSCSMQLIKFLLKFRNNTICIIGNQQTVLDTILKGAGHAKMKCNKFRTKVAMLWNASYLYCPQTSGCCDGGTGLLVSLFPFFFHFFILAPGLFGSHETSEIHAVVCLYWILVNITFNLVVVLTVNWLMRILISTELTQYGGLAEMAAGCCCCQPH